MNLLDRITQLAGPAVAATLQLEFGGTQAYIWKATVVRTEPPIRVVLHGHFDPMVPMAQLIARLPHGLRTLGDHGLLVTDIGIPAQGMGEAHVAALRGPLARHGVDVMAMR